jgi:hypothetical protein
MTSPTILSAPHVSTKYKPNAEKKRGETRRIEQIYQMDKRHGELLAAGDRDGLLELAGEYLLLGNHGGCPGLASRITAEAMNL